MIRLQAPTIYVGTAAPGCPVEQSSTALSPSQQLPDFARPDSRRRLSPQICLSTLLAVLLLSLSASAQTLTGTVKNATTGKPSSGDEVVLLSLGQGMEEAGRTKSDAKGNFSFKLDAQGPHLVRVIHQDVTYHRMAPPGTTSTEVEVYDVGKKVEGIDVVADIMRVQVEQGQLEIMRAFAVQNHSKPPRTQMNERNLEFYVPEGAQIVQSSAMTANGQPVNSAPVPVDDKKTRYSFLFPLRPGTTQFEVAYQVAYTGSANIDPKTVYPLQHFVTILPKSMQFSPAPGTKFQSMNDPQQPDANVQVASSAAVGQPLAFKISGEGTLQDRQDSANASASAGQPGASAGAPPESRPGGGLGPPIDAPNPLQRYQLPVIIGLGVILAAGGVFVAFRQQTGRIARTTGSAALEEEYVITPAPVRDSRASQESRPAEDRVQPAAPRSSPSALLHALKDELFDLEVEHKQGRISQQEYEKTKAALDQTLERALKREAQKA